MSNNSNVSAEFVVAHVAVDYPMTYGRDAHTVRYDFMGSFESVMRDVANVPCPFGNIELEHMRFKNGIVEFVFSNYEDDDDEPCHGLPGE